MQYDFDKRINRRGSDSLKWDTALSRGIPEDALPLWVADMDFAVFPELQKDIEKRAASGNYGYCVTAEGHDAALCNWMQVRHNWAIDEKWILPAIGVVFSFALATRALSKEGDGVLIQTPVYPPFYSIIENNNRRIVDNPLVLDEARARYEIDFDDFEKKISPDDVTVFLLCSPHNPVGRVWTRDELCRMAELCDKHHVAVIADEIHHDLVFSPHIHTVFQTLPYESAARCITCTAPSKTFNLAGLQHADPIIADRENRLAFQKELDALGYSDHSSFGSLACRDAHLHGGPWLDQLLEYLQGNVAFVEEQLQKKMPKLRLIEPQGLYLLWLDARGLGLNQNELQQFMQQEARLWFNEGYTFGATGAGFERINIACPRKTLKEAMDRLRKAYRTRF